MFPSPPEDMCHVLRLNALNSFVGVRYSLGPYWPIHIYQAVVHRCAVITDELLMIHWNR